MARTSPDPWIPAMPHMLAAFPGLALQPELHDGPAQVGERAEGEAQGRGDERLARLPVPEQHRLLPDRVPLADRVDRDEVLQIPVLPPRLQHGGEDLAAGAQEAALDVLEVGAQEAVEHE